MATSMRMGRRTIRIEVNGSTRLCTKTTKKAHAKLQRRRVRMVLFALGPSRVVFAALRHCVSSLDQAENDPEPKNGTARFRRAHVAASLNAG